VATAGTAMTEMHLKRFSRMTNDIRLAYDGDEAGVRAAERAISMASKFGIYLSVIDDYHGCKDADELIQKDAELWQKAVNSYRPALEWLLEKYEGQYNLKTEKGFAEYAAEAKRLIDDVFDELQTSRSQTAFSVQTAMLRLLVDEVLKIVLIDITKAESLLFKVGENVIFHQIHIALLCHLIDGMLEVLRFFGIPKFDRIDKRHIAAIRFRLCPLLFNFLVFRERFPKKLLRFGLVAFYGQIRIDPLDLALAFFVGV
jgi:hypothetical protein